MALVQAAVVLRPMDDQVIMVSSSVKTITAAPSAAAEGRLAAELLEALAREWLSAGRFDELRWICAHPDAPEPLLMELCRFPELHDALGHRSGPRRVLEVLAEDYDYAEAVLTLGVELFLSGEASDEELRRFLGRHRGNAWLFERLLHVAETSDPRVSLILEAVSGTPIEARVRWVWTRLQQVEQAKRATSAQEILRLRASGEPKVLVALAGNVHAPDELLRELLDVQGTPHARRIRSAALATLQHREKARGHHS